MENCIIARRQLPHFSVILREYRGVNDPCGKSNIIETWLSASFCKLGFRWQSEWHHDMDWKVFLTIFGAVVTAELGDKYQLATILFATDKEVSKYTVFFTAPAALIIASALVVLAGTLLSEYINEKRLYYNTGVRFIGIGIFTLYNA